MCTAIGYHFGCDTLPVVALIDATQGCFLVTAIYPDVLDTTAQSARRTGNAVAAIAVGNYFAAASIFLSVECDGGSGYNVQVVERTGERI